MSVATRHVNGGLKHYHAKWNAWNPADETNYGKDAKQKEHDSSAPLFSVKVVNGCADGEDAVEDPSDPDELLCKVTCAEKVCPRQDERDTKHKNEENQSVCVESKVVAATVDAAPIEASSTGIFVYRDARDSDVAEKDGDELSPVLSAGQMRNS